MANRFCLLDLNEDCIKTVLKCFDRFDLISFSLCSKKRLANVRSLKLHIEDFRIVCRNVFYAQLIIGGHFTQLFFCEDGYDRRLARRDNRPRRLQVDYIEDGEKTHRWRKANFRGNDWLRHLMDVFNCDSGLMILQESKFEIDSLVEIVQNLKIIRLTISQNVTKPYTLSYLRAHPCFEILDVNSLTFDESSEYSILLRNQQSLCFPNGIKITLDIVLSVNSLVFDCTGLPIKDINRFIKLWKKGANPRVRLLHGFFRASGVNPNENEVLRGVPYKRMPQGTVRMLEMPAANHMRVVGGFDIVGKNGRKATVTLRNGVLGSSFRMYIW